MSPEKELAVRRVAEALNKALRIIESTAPYYDDGLPHHAKPFHIDVQLRIAGGLLREAQEIA
ncbi:MAG: hypothetical protein KGL39_48345 [Patescibacteria group bacterium]|nr:hypothetical protein [Patescibacteria group bacterium]